MIKKKSTIISVIVGLIIILLLFIIILLNVNKNLNKINNENFEALELVDGVTTEIKKMDSGKIYCLIKFTENTGIRQITYPNGFTIYLNKVSVAIDYVIEPDTNYEFIVINGDGDIMTRTVREEYDNTPPQKATIEFDSKKVDLYKTIKATVTQEDLYIGIDITKCKYIINNSEEEIGIESNVWDSATVFSSNPQIIDITKSEKGNYYVHVLSIDKVGNKIETISERILFQGEVTYLNVSKNFGSSWNNYYYFPDWTVVGSTSEMRPSIKSNGSTYIISNKKFNFDDIDSLTFWISSINANLIDTYGTITFGLCSEKDASTFIEPVSTVTKNFYGAGALTMNLDISSITGDYYICIKLNGSSSNNSVASLYLSGAATIIGK